MLNSINGGNIIRKSSSLSFFYPSIVIAVAVEDNSLMFLDSLNKELVEVACKVCGILEFISEFLEFLSNDSVEDIVCAGDSIGRTE